MIEVDRLTKTYHATRAVDRLSFRAGSGEIIGLLGPNGAGKTTTMRMLTTFLAPTSGRAVLAGHDVLDEPLEVRRRVGYLPESVPLPAEMRVREYIEYRARLKDVPRRGRRAAIDRVLDRCQVRDVERKTLGHLSKGYRQRVGLADAMVHDPDILVLDEPTSGLDPIQIREVRDLIRELGDRHTILLSTHILPEVEAVCGRVLMIVGGRLAIDEKLDDLDDRSAVAVEVRGPAAAVRRAIEAAPPVRRVAVVEEGQDRSRFEVQGRDGADVREAVAAAVVRGGWGLLGLDRKRSTLEERFVRAVHEASLRAAEPADPAEAA